MNEEIKQYKLFNELKAVYRDAVVGDRHESAAEHSWGCLILADFFLNNVKQNIDKLKVYELLMYHDVVEIETGDTKLHPSKDNTHHKERELEASRKLAERLPSRLREKYTALFEEFENQETVEARFAKAIDKLEAEIHELGATDKSRWKGWTLEFLVTQKGHFFEEFPELKKTFAELIEYWQREKFFDE